MRFDDALHEFTTLPGVKEDVTDIILNLKDLLVRSVADEPVTLRFDKRGPGDATAADLQITSEVEVLNPELHIASLNAKGRIALDITVERGRGYVSADKNKRSSTIGVIPVDSIFSPVRRVTFAVEPVRVETGTASSGSPDLDLRIEELDLSERPRNCLKRAQINTIGELVERSLDDLLAITNFGQKSADEVVQRLDERGLSLRTKD